MHLAATWGCHDVGENGEKGLQSLCHFRKEHKTQKWQTTKAMPQGIDIQISQSLCITWKITKTPVLIETSSVGSRGSPEWGKSCVCAVNIPRLQTHVGLGSWPLSTQAWLRGMTKLFSRSEYKCLWTIDWCEETKQEQLPPPPGCSQLTYRHLLLRLPKSPCAGPNEHAEVLGCGQYWVPLHWSEPTPSWPQVFWACVCTSILSSFPCHP